MFLNGNFVALGAFKERYGVQVAGQVGKTIPTKWQSSLFQAGQCGAFIGVFLAGPITNRKLDNLYGLHVRHKLTSYADLRSWLQMDNPLGAHSHERHHLHLFLR
jgi:hypothetical protein